MSGVIGSRRDLIFVISELYYEVGGRHFVVGGKIAGCRHILTGLEMWVSVSLRNLGLHVVHLPHGKCYFGNVPEHRFPKAT